MSFWSALKRRRVVRVAIAYAVVSIAVGEAADVFLPGLGGTTKSIREIAGEWPVEFGEADG